MNDLINFMHWFEGFCDAIDTQYPTAEQWQTLQQRIHTLNEATMPPMPKTPGSGDSYMDEKGGWLRDRLVPRHTDGEGL